MNNGTYIDYLQEARVHFLLSGPPVLHRLLSDGVLVVAHQVEYLAPVGFSAEPLRIVMWLDEVGGSRFAIGYDLFDAEVLAARARTVLAPYDLRDQRLRRLSPEERALFTAQLRPAEPLRTIDRVAIGDRPHHRYALTVRWSDLDSYGHVNNVKYYDYVQEARVALIDEALGWSGDDVWVIVRQDLEYRRPIGFRLPAYEVATMISAIGTRSFTVAAEIREPDGSTVYATARTVVVSQRPLTEDQRAAITAYAATGR